MSLFYKLAYRLGITPWEEAADHPPAAQAIAALFDREQEGRLVWDFGSIHGLNAEQREAVGREASAVAAPGATALILAWEPGRRGPLPRGASRAEIEAAFPGWEVVDDQPFDASGLPGPLRGVEPRVYRLKLG